MLADSGFEDFGYISANVPIRWTTSSEAALLKTGRGDRSQDTGFTADRLSSVNNDGSMEYRLVFTNLSSANIYTGVSFLDVLPVAGDIVSQGGSDRNSQWSMSLNAGSIQLHRLLTNGSYEQLDEYYRVFYYNQPIENSQDMSTVYADIEKLTFDARTLPPAGAKLPLKIRPRLPSPSQKRRPLPFGPTRAIGSNTRWKSASWRRRRWPRAPGPTR